MVRCLAGTHMHVDHEAVGELYFFLNFPIVRKVVGLVKSHVSVGWTTSNDAAPSMSAFVECIHDIMCVSFQPSGAENKSISHAQ